MIINNIVAFLYHILLVILSTIYLMIVVSLGENIESILNSLIVRVLLVLLWVGVYIYIGTRLKRSQRKKEDFFSGALIVLIGLVLFFYSIIDVEFLTFFKVYINPVYQIFLTLGIEFSTPIRILSVFMPSILIWIGVRFKRNRNSRGYSKAY